MRTLIKNGTIVTAVDQYRGDVLVEDEKIALIGTTLADIHADKMIDATGKYVLPGGIDVHTHLDMPFGGVHVGRRLRDRARRRRHSAARRRSSTSRFSTRARRCITRGKRG